LGRQKGDRVTSHAGWSRTAVAMLACARIGAVHSVVFGGFLTDSWPIAFRMFSNY